MNIRPLHDRVIVTRQEEAQKTASGIVILAGSNEFDGVALKKVGKRAAALLEQRG